MMVMEFRSPISENGGWIDPSYTLKNRNWTATILEKHLNVSILFIVTKTTQNY
jgi:hypothetical protein